MYHQMHYKTEMLTLILNNITDIPNTARLLLVSLVNHANKKVIDGRPCYICWPSDALLSDQLNVQVGRVRTYLTLLNNHGYIRQEYVTPGDHIRREIYINLDRLRNPDAPDPLTDLPQPPEEKFDV